MQICYTVCIDFNVNFTQMHIFYEYSSVNDSKFLDAYMNNLSLQLYLI